MPSVTYRDAIGHKFVKQNAKCVTSLKLWHVKELYSAFIGVAVKDDMSSD